MLAYRARHPERVQATQRRTNDMRRRRRRTKEGGEAMRARDRAYRRKHRERINANRRRRELADMGAAKSAAHRRYRERHPERVLEQTRRQNARPERMQAKKEYAHLYQTRYVGPGVKPHCRQDGCENEIPWDGKGRPRLDCYLCRPLDSQERKSVRSRRLASMQEDAGSQGRRRSA